MPCRSRRTIGAALAVVLSACGVTDPDVYETERDRLAASRELWSSQGFDSYAYVLQPRCYCLVTAAGNVFVRNGQITGVTSVETGEPVPQTWLQVYMTVDQLFALIEDAIDRSAHSLDIAYHAQYGYPTHIRIDYIENMIDEEMGFEASSLAPLR
jgi:hypothetical protein